MGVPLRVGLEHRVYCPVVRMMRYDLLYTVFKIIRIKELNGIVAMLRRMAWRVDVNM